MKFRAKLVLFIFGFIYLIIGVIMILYSLGIIESQDFLVVAKGFQNLLPTNILLGISGGILILVVVLLLNFVWSGVEAERNIAFKTDYGEVLISLGAIEEYVRKLLKDSPDIREVKTKVIARKKGLLVLLRAVIISEINIPSVTEKIQSQLRGKLQEMLGMEEPITVRLYVAKIGEKEKKKKNKQGEEVTQEPFPPYRKF